MSVYGVLPKLWVETELNMISSVITDGAHSSPKPQTSGRYMCSVKDMTYNKFDFSDTKLISEEDFQYLVNQGCKPEQGDLLISKDGANCLDLLFLYYQKEEIVLLSSIAIVRLKDSVCKEYVRYFLLSPDCQFIMKNNYVSGSAIPRVVLKDFKKVPITLPPITEQKAIASVLSSLDDKIDLLHRQNKTLESMAETLFRQWFVEVSQDNLQKSNLTQLIDLQSGYAFKSKNFIESGKFQVIKIKNISGNIIDINSTDFIEDNIAINLPDWFHLNSGQILVAMTGAEIGKLGLIPKNNAKLVLNQRVGLFMPKFPGADYLAYLHLKHEFGQDYINNAATGSAQPNISGSLIESCPFPQCEFEFLKNCGIQIKIYFEKIVDNLGQIQTLEKLRDTLLPKLMSGEVRVQYTKA